MPPTDESKPEHWFAFGDRDFDLVEVAVRNGVASSSVLAKLVEGLEKHLKGFLIGKGWRLVRTHDVQALLRLAIGFDGALAGFESVLEPLAEAYVEGRYPGFDVEEPTVEELRQILREVRPLVDWLKKGASPFA